MMIGGLDLYFLGPLDSFIISTGLYLENIIYLCGMEKTIRDYITENENLRQELLAQEGGLMKYFAEHLDANGIKELFKGYQAQCAEQYFESDKWNFNLISPMDKQSSFKVLYHLKEELKYQSALTPILTKYPKETEQIIIRFYDSYLDYAYLELRRRKYPQGITDSDIYREVIVAYSQDGLAYKCMEIILREHHEGSEMEKTETDLWTEFLIRQWSDELSTDIFRRMRRKVAEMLMGKANNECTQMTIDTLEVVRSFSQKIYTDQIVKALRKIEHTQLADQIESDGKWMREIAIPAFFSQRSPFDKRYSMHHYFANFVFLLKNVERIWGAQLLVRGIDIQKIEEENVCILNDDQSLHRYVDKYYINDLPGEYCISDYRQAEKKLKEIGTEVKQDVYFTIVDDKIEAEIRNKLSKAYIVLKEEGIINASTNLDSFIDVLTNNADKKIVWQNDSNYKILMTLIKVFIGYKTAYDYNAILTRMGKGGYPLFIKKHFLDENNNPIDIKSNDHDIGKKGTIRFERILKAIYGKIKLRSRGK